MVRYAYTARSKPGEEVRGIIEAESEADAVGKLAAAGQFPIDIATDGSRTGTAYTAKVSRREVNQFTRQMATLIGAGVSIVDGLGIILRQQGAQGFKNVIRGMTASIQDGKTFSESMEEFPRVFPRLYCAMVRTGETGGTLKEVLGRLALFLEKEEEFRQSLASALIYPSFVLAVGFMTVVLLLVLVIPGLTAMFEDMGQMLPLPTRILIALSEAARRFWLPIAAVVCGCVIAARKVCRTQRAAEFVDTVRLTNRVTGPIAVKAEVSRFARTLSVLLSSGVIITRAMEVASDTVGNSYLRKKIVGITGKLREGLSFSAAAQESGVFPEFLTNIVAVGEETGALGPALMKAADEYDAELDRALHNLSRVLEPAIILVVGLIVAFIVMAMLLPIFEINILVR